MLLLGEERWDEALAAAAEALERDPEDREAIIARIFALVTLDRTGEAVDDARRRLADDPTDAGAHAMLGLTSMASGDHEAALDSFREARRIDPTKDWLGEFGLIALGLTGRPLYSVVIAQLLSLPRWSGNPPSRGVMLLGPIGLLVTLGRVSVGPLSTLALRCSRYGRLAVTSEDAAATNWFAGLLLAAAVGAVVGAIVGGPAVAGALLLVALLGVVVVGVAFGHDPWGRRAAVCRVAAGFTAGLALWLLVPALLLLA